MTTPTITVAAQHKIPALDRLPPGVGVIADEWVLKHESPEMLDLISRFLESQLVAPVPPLESVAVYYDVYCDAPFTIALYCLSPEMSFDKWYQWTGVLSQREREFKASLSSWERDLVTHRIEADYGSGPPGITDGEPSWFQEAKYWPKLSH